DRRVPETAAVARNEQAAVRGGPWTARSEPAARSRDGGDDAGRPPPAEGEGRGAEQADAEVEQVQQQAEGDGLLVGRPEGTEEQHERTLADAEPGDADGQDLGDGDGGEEGEQCRGPDLDAHPDGLGGEQGGEHEDELVGEADGEDVDGGPRVAAEALDAEVDGGGEPAPAVAVGVAGAEALGGDGEEHADE